MMKSTNMYRTWYIAPDMAVSRKNVETIIHIVARQTVSRDWASV